MDKDTQERMMLTLFCILAVTSMRYVFNMLLHKSHECCTRWLMMIYSIGT